MSTSRYTNVARGPNVQIRTRRHRLPRRPLAPVRLRPRRAKMAPPANDNVPSFARKVRIYGLRGGAALLVGALIAWIFA